MKKNSNTIFILLVVGILIMIVSAILSFKFYHSMNALILNEQIVFFTILILFIGLAIGVLYIALAEILIILREIRQHQQNSNILNKE